MCFLSKIQKFASELLLYIADTVALLFEQTFPYRKGKMIIVYTACGSSPRH